MTSIAAVIAPLFYICPWRLFDLKSGLQAIKVIEGKMMGILLTKKRESLNLSHSFGIIDIELQATFSEACDIGFLWTKTKTRFII